MTLSHLARRSLPSAAAVLLLAGCYSEFPLTAAAPAPAAHIIAQVTDTGIVVMGNRIGPGATAVEGIVASADATAWRLMLLRVDQRGGASSAWNREEVVFPRYTLTNVAVKRFDKKRSWIAAATIGVVAILAAKVFGAFDVEDAPVMTTPPPA